jgi:hypothetical protein
VIWDERLMATLDRAVSDAVVLDVGAEFGREPEEVPDLRARWVVAVSDVVCCPGRDAVSAPHRRPRA